MLDFGAALAPPAPPPTLLRLRLTTPCWPYRYSRTLCSCYRFRCSKTSAFVCYVDASTGNNRHSNSNNTKKEMRIATRAISSCCNLARIALLAVAVVIFSTAPVIATEPPPPEETLSNIPQVLSGECTSPSDCKKARIQHPKSRKAESCTIKCVTTCIRGGAGSPGEGPLNARRTKDIDWISNEDINFASSVGLWWCSRQGFEAVNTAWSNALTSVI